MIKKIKPKSIYSAKGGRAVKKKSVFQQDMTFTGVSISQKAMFAKHLSVMLKAGLSIVESLQIAQSSATGKLKELSGGVLKSVESGNSLAESFSRYPKVFSGAFVSATLAGEKSGSLEKNMANLATQLEKEKELISKIRGAMLYPMVVFVAAFILGLSMAFFVLPKILPLFEGMKMDLPLSTRMLIVISRFITDHGSILLLAIAGTIIAFIWIVRQKWSQPVTHWVILHIPIISRMVRNTNLAKFCLNFSTMLKSGLTINESLEIVKDTVDNHYYKKALTIVNNRISRGSKVSDNMRAYPKLFPLLMVEMIRVGEESGGLEDTLEYMANFYEIEVDQSAKTLATAIEPILLMGIGLVVAFLALSIITPIYNITGNIGQ